MNLDNGKLSDYLSMFSAPEVFKKHLSFSSINLEENLFLVSK